LRENLGPFAALVKPTNAQRKFSVPPGGHKIFSGLTSRVFHRAKGATGSNTVAFHRFINPESMHATRGYSHIVETTSPSRTIYLAGQLGRTRDGKFAGAPGDFRAQAEQCFENVRTALAEVGATFEHVVKVTNYFVDIAHMPIYLEIRNRYVNPASPPASTAIQISRLAHDGGLFELDAVAVVPL
jgi:enamine deaminase RidA (YjgF/YER057c/UK114 family)